LAHPSFWQSFPNILVAADIWHPRCSPQGWPLARRRGGLIMETVRARDIEKNSDSALVTATKRGDMQAFEQLVARHERRAVAMAQRITRNREDAEDIVQEGFHKAFRHLDTFEEKSRFSTWLTRIIMNEAFMLLRRRRGVFEDLSESTDDGVKSISETFVDGRPNPEESCSRREHTQLLTEAINRLGPRVRRAILLRDIEEKSIAETAQILGTTPSAVKARVFQGRRKLRATVIPGLQWKVYASGPRQAQHC
jgi:RNA polymerase sigma-70 factor, ECF subfamily